MAHHQLSADHFVYTFGGLPPAYTIEPGDTITARTRDARGGDEHGAPLPAEFVPPATGAAWLPSNPCVGPIHVSGAEPGDALAIHIDAIDLNRDQAWSSVGGHMGSLTAEAPGRELLLNEPVPTAMYHWQLDRERHTARLELPQSRIGAVEIPLHPFIGSIGVAPRFGRVETTLAPGDYGGNMDCVETQAGTTLYLPVWAPGALLSFGDIHAAQGDGEICKSALETTAAVTLTIDLVKGWSLDWPRLEDATWIMTAGSSRPLFEALQIAQVELLKWLVADYGYDRAEAWQVNSQAGRMRIGNIVDPNFTVVAKFPKALLPT